MEKAVLSLVQDAIFEIIQKTISDDNIKKNIIKHQSKIHFIPIKYRVIGGLLQSLNIKFGYFIEKLIAQVIEKDSNAQSLPLSGKKVKLSMTARTDSLIDQYNIPAKAMLSFADFSALRHQKIGIPYLTLVCLSRPTRNGSVAKNMSRESEVSRFSPTTRSRGFPTASFYDAMITLEKLLKMPIRNRGLAFYQVAPRAGLEPATHSLEGCCSIH